MNHTNTMPDVSRQFHSEQGLPIDYVGMTKVEMPVWVPVESGEKFRQSARIDAFVSLDNPQVKGIHMSRLYLLLQDHFQSEIVSLRLLEELLGKFIQSQDDISQASFISIRLDWPVQRKALLSGEQGWRTYPIELSARLKEKKVRFYFSSRVTYSSTCPCSAALSRQLIQKQFLKDFSSAQSVSVKEGVEWLGKESSMVATPHAQRSHADFKLELKEGVEDFIEFIDLVEQSLGTPVQTVVKRQDEQEFARLNASQLMFCEDAARKIQKVFEKDSRILGYWAKFEHLEGLHPHNVMSVVSQKMSENLP